jgi:hypothetical protein
MINYYYILCIIIILTIILQLLNFYYLQLFQLLNFDYLSLLTDRKPSTVDLTAALSPSPQSSPIAMKRSASAAKLLISSPTVYNTLQSGTLHSSSPSLRRLKKVVISEDEDDVNDNINNNIPIVEIPESSPAVITIEPSQQSSLADEHDPVLDFFNSATPAELLDYLQCSNTQAATIASLRPFHDSDDLESKLSETKGVQVRMIDAYTDALEMYTVLDEVVQACADISRDLSSAMQKWVSNTSVTDEEAGLHFTGFEESSTDADLIHSQPDFVNPDLKLKDYQLLGISWLSLLYRKGLSGILADEMVFQ